ncbi:alpha-1,3-arabinosyltransferase XAT2-like isoform X2 [Nymphaea colorata]|uniref:alpha-1,3-arabinosyltransferase XAT2-like isoform X2 n=1 Tax=Nymphaea colorata TaxID=210225 RepID=UPI00129D409B|nr:alpha-1,3-arabinosyltransferase XAT2-like isoform X2 [Nymphaea colorata]
MKQQQQKEMSLLRSLSRHEARKLGYGAIVAGCALLLVFFLSVFSALFGPVHNYELKLSVGPGEFMAKIESPLVLQPTGPEAEGLKLSADDLRVENNKETAGSFEQVESELSTGDSRQNTAIIEKRDSIEAGSTDQEEKKMPICDFSKPKSNICYIEGDIRIHRNSSTILFVNPRAEVPADGFWKLRPYARKTDMQAMSGVTELKVKPVSSAQDLPSCSVNHSVPGLVFSTGGYNGNLFHDFTDVIVPLFLTSHHHNGEVQFINTDGKSWWPKKFGKILKRLSHYDIIDHDNDYRVHCFTKLRVGLTVHKEFSIDPTIKSFNGYSSMEEFRKLMMDSYSLSRDRVIQIRNREMKKPRLLILSRRRTRKLRNLKQTIKLAKNLGFDVVVADDGLTLNMAKFVGVVNSCDVMMGVHGAGLTNMVFLPAGAVVIQIVPFGRLDWISTAFFARPARDMKLNYLEYKINMEESTLVEQYPLDDPVLKDPISIHKKGWNFVEEVYLRQQDVNLNLSRFKSILVDAQKLLQQQTR